jgi:hypothetical protein
MERFIIVLALTGAALIAVASAFGGADDWNVNIQSHDDQSAHEPSGQVPGVAGKVENQVFAGVKLRLDDTAAILTVIPEARADIAIDITNPGALPMPRAQLAGDTLVIDGSVRRVRSCSITQRDGGPRQFEVGVPGQRTYKSNELPTITARVPMAVSLETSSAVLATIGNASSVTLKSDSCGAVTMGAVTGPVAIRLNGASDVEGVSATKADIYLAGSGSVSFASVTEGMTTTINGSGSVNVGALRGDLSMALAGSGDFEAENASLGDANIDIAGSGDVSINGSAAKLDAKIAGSGDIELNGTVGDLSASIVGSGDVRVEKVTGKVEKSSLGSGDVVIESD